MSFRRRAGTLVGATFLVYALLVATHLGEFWPFSIYPMFSQAGNSWSRSIVREVEVDSVRWQPVAEADALPGVPFALTPRGIDPIDLSNFVAKTDRWDGARRAGLRRMFYDQLAPAALAAEDVRSGSAGADEAPATRRLLVVRANGDLVEGDSVAVEFVPYVLMRPDTTLMNPRLHP